MGGQNFVTTGPVPDLQNDKLNLALIPLATNYTQTPVTVVPANSGKRITLHGGIFSTNSSNFILNVIDANTGGATVTTQNVFAMQPNSPVVLPYSQYPYATIGVGNALCVSNGVNSTVNVFGSIWYVQG